MSHRFDPTQGLVVVSAELTGPAGAAVIRLALDTGATSTLINAGILVALGYEPSLARGRTQVTTGSGVEYVPKIALRRIKALGQARSGFAVLCHTLPPSASVDGLLGLDFLRKKRLAVDFRKGVIEVR